MFSTARAASKVSTSRWLSALEIIMTKSFQCSGTIALAFSAVLAASFADEAFAQAKKLSYEQAWAQCRKEIAVNVPMTDATTSAARYTAGGACMKRYGYRLKRSSM
jgi:hypothetical protein